MRALRRRVEAEQLLGVLVMSYREAGISFFFPFVACLPLSSFKMATLKFLVHRCKDISRSLPGHPSHPDLSSIPPRELCLFDQTHQEVTPWWVMADPFSIAGVAYPIAKELLSLAVDMKKVYDEVHHAKPNFYKVISRTKTVARTYDFFMDTMSGARKIDELTPMFKRHRKLMRRVKTESERVIKRLKHIIRIFRFLIDGRPITAVDKWIAWFRWYRHSKKFIPPLFQEMKVLERSMRTIGILVTVQMLQNAHLKDRSSSVLPQL